MKKYLIIGGAGFIGSHLSETLSKQNNKVVIIDNSAVAPIVRGFGIKIYKFNIENVKKITNVFEEEKPEFVFHLAGAINLRRSITDTLFLKDMDFLSRTKIILDASKKHNVKKIIFISSGGAIYENAKIVPTLERYPPHPTSLYGLANLMIEKYIFMYCKNYGMSFVISRLSNAYGPRQWKSGFIPAVITKILKKERPVIYGTGNQTRDFVYISDVIEALIMLAKKGKNTIYNVGSNKEISLNEVFEITKKLLGAKIRPVYKNLGVAETMRSAMDAKKIKKEFGWSPKVSIEEGILKTIEWYKENG